MLFWGAGSREAIDISFRLRIVQKHTIFKSSGIFSGILVAVNGFVSF